MAQGWVHRGWLTAQGSGEWGEGQDTRECVMPPSQTSQEDTQETGLLVTGSGLMGYKGGLGQALE